MTKANLRLIPGSKQAEREASNDIEKVIGILRAQIMTGAAPDTIVAQVRAVVLDTFETPIELQICRKRIVEVLEQDAILKPRADSMAESMTTTG